MNLGRADGSYALLSPKEPADTAVIFVHGFDGNPTTTWLDFQSLVDQGERIAPAFATSDLYFYGYESLNDNVLVHTSRLADFIRRVHPEPDFPSALTMSPAMRQFIPAPEDTDLGLRRFYSRLVLVGHSLGAVLIRAAMVDLCQDHENRLYSPAGSSQATVPAVLNSELRLFAPAIFGFKPVGLKGFIFHFCLEHPKLKTFAKPALTAFAPIHDDVKEGSARLEKLQERTEELSEKHPEWTCLRARTIFGTLEEIVYMDRYACDATPEFVEGQDHTSICKPNPAYTRPLEFVSNALRRPAAA